MRRPKTIEEALDRIDYLEAAVGALESEVEHLRPLARRAAMEQAVERMGVAVDKVHGIFSDFEAALRKGEE